MAAANPLAGEPSPLEYTMFFNGLNAVLRTRRRETTAMTDQRTDESLIEPNKENSNFSHRDDHREFSQFLKEFVPVLAKKSKMLNQAYWILETTGSCDAAELKAALDIEYQALFNNPSIYQKLLEWEKLNLDPIKKRELNILIRSFRQYMAPQELLEEIAQKEAELAQLYATFRPVVDQKGLSENEIREVLKNELDPALRQKVWEASKEIGNVLAPHILSLVKKRNELAKHVGFSDYFQMQLALQEVDGNWLDAIFEKLKMESDAAYEKVIEEIEEEQKKRFSTTDLANGLEPWYWSDPFCQEDPLDSSELDQILHGIDLVAMSKKFYDEMGIDVTSILQSSDLFEREGKNQHAFCMNIDREKDVRTLNNVKSSLKWLETLLHELGHAIYEIGFDSTLPWLLREPPHMITTEAMALLAGRFAYKADSLAFFTGEGNQKIREKAEAGLKRRQLIFSRWVFVMTEFEKELYRDPDQDLQKLWWDLVYRYQKIKLSKERRDQADWAAKYHIGLAPVYYFSYLLGEMFASMIQESILEETKSEKITTPQAKKFLVERLFAPGASLSWDALIEHVCNKPISSKAWVKEFAT